MLAFTLGHFQIHDHTLLANMSIVASKKLDNFENRSLATFLWALGKLDSKVDPQLTRKLAAHAT